MKRINWDELYRRNAPRLIGICRRYTGDEALARDLVHDTFVTAMEKIADYKGKGSLEAWIRKIAVNHALMFLRKQSTKRITSDNLSHAGEIENEMDTPVRKIQYAIEEASFTTGELLTVIDALPLHHKAVFNLYVIDGYKHKQIAEMLGISPGTSKSHLARARKKAQELLYERALEKEPEEKQRKRMLALFLLLPNRIDRLFRQGFRRFEIPSVSVSSLGPPMADTFIQQGLTFAGKLLLSGVAASFITAGFFVARPYLFNKTPIGKPKSVVVTDSLQRIKTPSLSPTKTDSLDLILQENAPPNKQETVIIKKQIVIHDTILLEKPH
ncbi:MAG TPA: sigma-70 family RNA polymerase sigma factor [Prolixibacteraceae bacterium]|nr:sigma-70 family RNA polymerase sigma factor [Prolixibacteraceae bacterium]